MLGQARPLRTEAGLAGPGRRRGVTAGALHAHTDGGGAHYARPHDAAAAAAPAVTVTVVRARGAQQLGHDLGGGHGLAARPDAAGPGPGRARARARARGLLGRTAAANSLGGGGRAAGVGVVGDGVADAINRGSGGAGAAALRPAAASRPGWRQRRRRALRRALLLRGRRAGRLASSWDQPPSGAEDLRGTCGGGARSRGGGGGPSLHSASLRQLLSVEPLLSLQQLLVCQLELPLRFVVSLHSQSPTMVT
jgi:hypothetical protein